VKLASPETTILEKVGEPTEDEAETESEERETAGRIS
jgi:hypothetical protein